MPDQNEIYEFIDGLWPEDPNNENSIKLKEYFDDLFNMNKDAVNWKTKYDELDSSWRKRYSERFSGKKDDSIIEEDINVEDEEARKRSFDDLFELKGV